MGWPLRAEVRAGLWASRAVTSARRQLASGRVDKVDLTLPPPHPRRGVRAVSFVLRTRRSTCLEHALVVQAWLAGHGQPRDVVIGVTGARGFAAHAWLDGQQACHAGRFHEIARLPARR